MSVTTVEIASVKRMDLSPSTSNTSTQHSNNNQPINAGSLNPFHNTMRQFAFNPNPRFQSKQQLSTTLPTMPTLPIFLSSSSVSLPSPTRKNKKRPFAPKGIPKYKEPPSKKRKKNKNYENVSHITHLINDNNHKIPSSITNTPNISFHHNTNNRSLSAPNESITDFHNKTSPLILLSNQMKINNNIQESFQNLNNYIHIQTSTKIKKTNEILNHLRNDNNDNNDNKNNTKSLDAANNKKVSDKKQSRKYKSKSMPQLHIIQQTVDGSGYLTRSKRRELEQKNKNNEPKKPPPPTPSLSPSVSMTINTKKTKTTNKDKKTSKKKPKTQKKKKPKKRLKKTKRKNKKTRKVPSNIIDGYLSNLSSTTLQCLDAEKKKKCVEWMNISVDIDNGFTPTTRLDRNCISNYVINKKHINTKWLKQNEDINMRFSMSYPSLHNKMHYADMDGESDENYIRLHCINLNRQYISLECPHCGIYLQCIALGDGGDGCGMIGFMCYNYPRCEYPLNCSDYQSKYIWNDVRYIGPYGNSKEDVNVLSFGENRHVYEQWHREQDRLNKKLTERINWKKLIRKSRHKQLNKLYNTLETFKSYNITTNKQVIYHVFNKKMDKINRFRHKNMIKFRRIVANEEDRPIRQEYEIKSIVNGSKIVLVPYPSKKRIYRTRSQTQKIGETVINEKKYSFDLNDISSESESDSNSNSNSDPTYKPSPMPPNAIFIDNEFVNVDGFENVNESEDDYDLLQYKKESNEITNIDKLTFIDLYKATKMKSNYSIKWLFDKIREISKRYENLQFQVFSKCMKHLLKPKTEMVLIENLALQSMPVLEPNQLPFDDVLQTKTKGKKIMNQKVKKGKRVRKVRKKKKVKQQSLDLKELPIFDLNAFANQFKLTEKLC